jgi:hypothetical protein
MLGSLSTIRYENSVVIGRNASLESMLGEFNGHVQTGLGPRCRLVADSPEILNPANGLNML